ncbi:hypothetical protein LINPERPRIM_LOCUS25232, partial [Linum perenne]
MIVNQAHCHNKAPLGAVFSNPPTNSFGLPISPISSSSEYFPCSSFSCLRQHGTSVDSSEPASKQSSL